MNFNVEKVDNLKSQLMGMLVVLKTIWMVDCIGWTRYFSVTSAVLDPLSGSQGARNVGLM